MKEDGSAEATQVGLLFPFRSYETFPVRHNRDGEFASTPADQLVPRNVVDNEVVCVLRNIAFDGRQGVCFHGKAEPDVLDTSRWETLGQVADVM